MEQVFSPTVIESVTQYGIFASLFVGLLIYVFKQNERREQRLMDFVEKVAPALQKIEDEICEIKKRMEK